MLNITINKPSGIICNLEFCGIGISSDSAEEAVKAMKYIVEELNIKNKVKKGEAKNGT